MLRKKIKHGFSVSKNIINKKTVFDYKEHFWSFTGAFIGIGLIAFIQSHSFSEYDNISLIGSFGASSVLIYGLIQSPLAQPRNLIGGHVISAIVGVTVYKVLPDILWLTAPLSVALSIVCMQITRTVHPPGGATALIAVIGSEEIKTLGYIYVISPVLTGSVILLITALIFNNMPSYRNYPNDKKFINWIQRKATRKKKD